MKIDFKRKEEEHTVGLIFKTKYNIYVSEYTLDLSSDEYETFMEMMKQDYNCFKDSSIQNFHEGVRAKYLVSTFCGYRSPKVGYAMGSNGKVQGGEFSQDHLGSFLWDVCKELPKKGIFKTRSFFRTENQRAHWEEDILDRLTVLKEAFDYNSSTTKQPSEESIEL